MLSKTPTEQPPTQMEIALHAYHIWEHAGRPHGHDAEHWQQAERELRTIHRQQDRALRHWEKSTGIRAKQPRRRR